MRENGKATKRHAPREEVTNRYLPYGILINKVATSRHAPPKVETATKRNMTHRLETNRFSERRFATNRNAIKHSSFPAIHSGGAVSTYKYPTGDKNIRVISTQSVGNRRVIPTTNVGDIRIIPTINDIPTKNCEKRMHLKQARRVLSQHEGI